MKFLIVFGLFAYLDARMVDRKCDGIMVHNINHVKEVLQKDIDSPYQMAINYDTNMLFFSYSSNDDGHSSFKSAYINLKTNEFNDIDGINGGFANAVDSHKNKVYLGGSDGLYEFDFNTQRAIHVDGSYHNIWQIFVKKSIYYTIYPEESVYIFENGEARRVPELMGTRAMLVAFDNNDNIYFSNSTGFYLHKKAKNYVTFLGDYNLNSITSDRNGNLFFSTPNGLFAIKDDNRQIEELASINNIYGMVVENDGNIIYATEDSIVRLNPTKCQTKV